jgi:hypothetical protein
MPFQSEKQRRYLWANEPEIARDWTDTYGSGIAKALGGRINYLYGGITHPGGRRGFPGGSGRAGDSPMPTGGSGANYGGPPGGGDQAMTYTAPINRHTGPTTKEALITGQKKKDIRDLIAKQQAEKDYTRQGVRKVGPQLGLAGSGVGGGFGNWASGLAGSKIGGGLGSMLFGPWGMLLGSLFGGGVGRRAYAASQTDEKETLRDIMLGQNTLLSNLLPVNKKPTGEGIQTIDIRDKFNRLGDVKRSAKDFIDLSKSYSEFDTIPNPKYHGLNVGRNYMGEGIGSDSVKLAGAKVTDRNEMKNNTQKFVDMYREGKYDNLQQAIEDADRYNAGETTNYEKVTGGALPDIFSSTLQEGLETYGEKVSESEKRQQELLKEMGI